MPRSRLTRRSALRAVALGAVAAPLAIGGSAASCLLADPPPQLLTLPTDVPIILQGSVVPPPYEPFTNWPAGGLDVTVPVQVYDPTARYQFLVMEDYGTPNSKALSQILGPGEPYDALFNQTNPDGGSILFVPVPPIEKPPDPNCHTFSLFVGPTTPSGGATLQPAEVELNQGNQGYVVLATAGYDMVTWLYDPSGGLAGCPTYDAGGLTDSAADAVADVASQDRIIIHVGNGG